MKKDLILLFSIVIVLVLLIKGVHFQTVDDYYSTHLDEIKPGSKIITFSIRCDTLVPDTDEHKKNYNKLPPSLREYVPSNGIILQKKKYVLRNNDTVYDILSRVTRYYKILIFATKSIDGGVYIKRIYNFEEFSAGNLSGWMFEINNGYPLKSANYKLSENDDIEWDYTCDLGKDLVHKGLQLS